jgi:zinc/manganese transport system permease protein
VIEWLVEPWTYPFMRWALVCCLILAGIHAYLGFHVVRRGVLFVDLAMAQMAALGAAIGVVLGIEHDTIGEYVLSALFALAAAVCFAAIRSRRVHQEAIVAIFYGMAMAATFVVLEHSPHGLDEVKHLLVGQVLTVAPGKVLVTALIYAVVGLVLARMHGRIFAVTEKRQGAPKLGPELVFYGAFALVVTSSVGLVGVLLVFAFLVMPAVAALLISGGTASALWWGTGLAAFGSFVGLHAAYLLDMPAAPVIVLALGGLLLLAALAGRLRG